jgi:hypothetical protein
MKKLLLSLILVLIITLTNAQVSVKDSSIFTPLISGSYAYQIPGGDLFSRFGDNSNVGVDVLFKTKKNWIWGIQYSYIFGDNVKENNILDNIKTKDGFIINSSGQEAIIRIFERGHTVMARTGRLINVLAPNPNSGIMLMLSAGYIQHKIKIDNIGNDVPQLNDEYKKGYDRFTNGIAAQAFAGYLLLSNSRLTNFYAGIEFTNAWTQSRRSLNYDTMQRDTKQRIDQLTGFRVGWIIPIYKKSPREFYYD